MARTFVITLALVTLAIADTRLDITLAARGLPHEDLPTDPSDPYAVVFYQATASDSYSRMGATETIENTYDPVWSEKFTFFVFPGSVGQRVKVEVWDSDWSNPHDPMGSVDFLLTELINAPGNRLELSLPTGTLIISGNVNATRTV